MKTTEKAVAAYTLSDELTDIELKLERAELLAADMADDYFRPYNNTDKDGKFAITFEHPRYEIVTEIILDYLFAIRNDLKALSELANEGAKYVRASNMVSPAVT